MKHISINKYDVYNDIVDELMSKGYMLEGYFYQTGNFEDENDIQILVKNGIALFWDYVFDRWLKTDYSNCKYSNGYPNGDVININDYL